MLNRNPLSSMAHACLPLLALSASATSQVGEAVAVFPSADASRMALRWPTDAKAAQSDR